MPMGKIRSAKRSSGSSFSSTVTTIVLAGLCIYGIWALSSNDFISPSTTTRTSSTEKSTSSSSSSFASSGSSDDSLLVKAVGKKSPPVFQDSQGNLPDDAIRHRGEGDAIPENQETKDPSQGDGDDNTTNGDNGDSAGNGGGDKEEQNAAVKEIIDSGGDQNAKGMKGEESKEEQEKQMNLQKQNSEESSITQGQEAEKTTIVVDGNGKENESVNDSDAAGTTGGKDEEEKTSNDKQEPADPKKHVEEEERSSTENQEPVDPKKHVITDEDQQKRLEQHQQKEDAQIKEGKKKAEQEGATRKDQEEHDESPVKDASKVNQPSDTEKGGNIPQESNESKKTWQTQKGQSENQKERRNDGTDEPPTVAEVKWQLCNTTAGADYIPCLDNEKAIAKLRSRHHYEHRERHCPEDPPTCLVPVPQGYKKPVQWPQSRDKIWYHNVPHTLLAEVKGHQNWVKVSGEFLTFPGGGTQFIHGALHYIDFLQEAVPDIAWGKHSRVILDVGCGVASLGGFLFERDVLTMSFAPKDEHEAQVQFALERGIPAISAVMGTQRLPYPSRVFDVVHCARCRVPWHAEGGALLLELNRVLRPGGYFVWSATPVYQTLEEDVQIWKEMSNLTVSMCWELVAIKKDKLNSVGAAIYHKPDTNDCYDKRAHNQPPMCKEDDDPNAAWYVPLQSCMHRVPTAATERGTEWPEEWPPRLLAAPYWLNKSQNGIYGKPAPDDFRADTEHWKGEVNKLYLRGLGIDWSGVRNIMDMRAVYGGFASALKDLKAWVMNVVNIDSPDTLPIIYERGLFGIYHDWCESFSTYPRTYDLLHADQLFSKLKKRCKLIAVVAEVDRIVRPGGKFIMRDDSHTVGEVEILLKSLHWEVRFTFSKNRKGILSAQKSEWRPDSYAPPS